MKDLLIWIAVLSAGIAILVAAIPLIPFVIAFACIALVWHSLARLVVYLFDILSRR